MTLYRVKDWDEYFENERSRRVDECSFVCVPNKQHGLGLMYILSLPEGLTVYAIWNLILGAASRQRKPRLGWLTANGKSDGIPWSHDEMAVRWRRSTSEINTAMQVLCSDRVGWIEKITTHEPTTNPDGMVAEGRKEGRKEEPTASAVGASNAAQPLLLPTDLVHSAVVLTYPTKAGRRNKAREWQLSQDYLEELLAGFPHIEVRSECQKALIHVKSGSDTLHTADGMKRFLFDWMGRADRWRLQGRAANSKYQPRHVDPDARKRADEERNARKEQSERDRQHALDVATMIDAMADEQVAEYAGEWEKTCPIPPAKPPTRTHAALREFIYEKRRSHASSRSETDGECDRGNVSQRVPADAS